MIEKVSLPSTTDIADLTFSWLAKVRAVVSSRFTRILIGLWTYLSSDPFKKLNWQNDVYAGSS
jgi:hypothetical protein